MLSSRLKLASRMRRLYCNFCVVTVLYLCVCVCVCVCCSFGCLLVAGWWPMRWPRDLPRLLNNKRLFRYSHGDSMKGAAQRRGSGRRGCGGGVVLMGGCLGEFRSGHCWLCGRWDSHYFSLLHPATPCLGSVPHFAFPSSVSISAFSPSVDLILLWADVFVVSPSFIFVSRPWLLFVSSTHHSLSSPLYFLEAFLPPSLFLPLLLPSNLLTSNNLSCVISLFPTTSSSTSLLFFRLSQLCVSLSSISTPPSQAH